MVAFWLLRHILAMKIERIEKWRIEQKGAASPKSLHSSLLSLPLSPLSPSFLSLFLSPYLSYLVTSHVNSELYSAFAMASLASSAWSMFRGTLTVEPVMASGESEHLATRALQGVVMNGTVKYAPIL